MRNIRLLISVRSTEYEYSTIIFLKLGSLWLWLMKRWRNRQLWSAAE